jgi:hypothetical protein
MRRLVLALSWCVEREEESVVDWEDIEDEEDDGIVSGSSVSVSSGAGFEGWFIRSRGHKRGGDGK